MKSLDQKFSYFSKSPYTHTDTRCHYTMDNWKARLTVQILTCNAMRAAAMHTWDAGLMYLGLTAVLDAESKILAILFVLVNSAPYTALKLTPTPNLCSMQVTVVGVAKRRNVFK